MTVYAPVTPIGLTNRCADACVGLGGPVVVAVDGPDAAHPATLAGEVADVLRSRGRAADVVRVADFIRPASVRMEYGATDPDTYLDGWFDYPAIDREVVSALRRDGRWLPRLWDAVADRSFRDRRRQADADQVVLVAGPMLLGRGLGFEVTVRLQMSEAALRRRTPDDQQWTIAPLLTQALGAPTADIEVRYEHPDRPAISPPHP
ncbi:hypothetical protein [Gordonia soli]|uniref:Uridine kinase n=1 Tax=Gordonia soli NBRC 108243 TaxID=1223545 RepID=M0QJW3_9ACTN|nr:hypothetical protein [Gordonia soli]GAC68838.1 hypothetical protein GS4_19_00280 [Gordonia soli NBRC 108243]